jgi:acyl carrier protein
MVTSQPDVATAIETFIRRHFRINQSDPMFSRDAHLFETGLVDSVGAVELITFVGATFGVALDDDDIFSEHFTTINGIADIVMACEGKSDERRAAVR